MIPPSGQFDHQRTGDLTSYQRSLLIQHCPANYSAESHIAGVGDFLDDAKSDLVWEDTITGGHAIWILKRRFSMRY